MAYNTVAIKKDVDGKPIPQLYNDILDVYEALKGRNGANRVELYDADGNPVDLAGLIADIITAITTTATTQLRAGTNNVGKVTIDTDARDLRGLAVNKPAANSVPAGTTYWSIDTDVLEVSDGTNWREV